MARAHRMGLAWRDMRTLPILLRSAMTLGWTALLGGALVAGSSPQTPVTYPAAQITAGAPLFVAYCGFCHGRDAMGGETGPDLTRSTLVAADVKGDKIKPLVHNGRPDKGMPPLNISESDLTSIVAFIHDQRGKAGPALRDRRKVAHAALPSREAAA